MSDRIMRLPAVVERTQLSRATIYRRMKAGEFPAHVSLGGNIVGWLESSIDGWIAAKASEGGKYGPPVGNQRAALMPVSSARIAEGLGK